MALPLNFWPSQVSFGGVEYPTVEHAYQAARCATTADREIVREARSPGEAKRLGRRMDPVEGWANVRDDVMLDLLRNKFLEPDLRRRLLSTGVRPLVEKNDWGDRYWGQVNGEGENRLGKLLEAVREECRSGPADGGSTTR
jgi:ribA/ribD-fused uncharacterized protein